MSSHVAVMTEEVMLALRPYSGGSYVDATLGGGTHTRQLLERSVPSGRVLSLDLDPVAIQRARQMLPKELHTRWQGVEANFRRLAEVAQQEGFAPVDGILMDLGLSSDELNDPERGFSFLHDGPLDMRLGPQANDEHVTAASIVNSWKESELAQIISEYGEERMARRVAAAIVQARKGQKILRTSQLAEIVGAALPRNYERGRIHPATRTFQALRIAVNDELGALKDAIQGAKQILKPGGRLAIISFHSLEDRIVKHTFRNSEDLKLVTKKPLIPSDNEIRTNPKARSAKLRIAEKK